MCEVILATERQFRKGQGIFVSQDEFPVETAPTEEAPLAQMVRARSCRAVILGIERYQKELYEALGASGGSEGAIMARFGVGHDGIDKALARRHNIVVTNTPGVLDASVAEHTIWLIGNLARKVPQQFRRTQDGNWQPETGIELSGKTLLVVGFGAIGRRVASIAHFGLGMKVLAVDVLSPRELAEAAGMTVQRMKATFGLNDCTTDLIGTLKDAHLVTLHIPASAETENLFDARLLGLMKRGALLVNTARGAVLDEEALYDALADGRLAGAALDVFKTEPYKPSRPDKDLRRLENAILTPHIASNTHEANERMARSCLQNIRNFFAGRLDDLTRVDAPPQ